MNHLLSILDLDATTLKGLLARAAEFKATRGAHETPLAGKSIGLLFEKPSTRTRVSFEVGVVELGGHPVVLSGAETQLGRGETIEDSARTLSRYLDCLVVRTFGQDRLVGLATAGTIPVVNALSDLEHPCQALADLMTIEELVGPLSGCPVAYIGDGNNVAHSFMLAATLAGMDVRIITPQAYAPDDAIVSSATAFAAAHGGRLSISHDPANVKGVRAVYTDVWASMGQETEAASRREAFAGFQVSQDLLGLTDSAIVLHCLPAHRGEEITADVFESHADTIFTQAENRLHVQKAVLEALV